MQALGPRGTGILLVGDSVLDSAADPSLMAAAGVPGVYNAALAGEPLAPLEEWTQRVLQPHFHPRTIVLGFDVNVLNGGLPGVAGLLANFHHSRPVAVAEGRADLVDQLDGWLVRNVALYRERSVLRQPFDAPPSVGTEIYDPPLSADGWNESFRSEELGPTAPAIAAAARGLRGDLFALFRQSAQNAASIASTIRTLVAHGAEVVFVALPESPALPGAVPGGQPEITIATNAMLGAAQDAGARTLNAGAWPAADFADGVHLDRAGTVRFSAWLAHALEASG